MANKAEFKLEGAGPGAAKLDVTEKEHRQRVKQLQQKRKSNPRMYVRDGDKTLIFEDKPVVLVTNEMLAEWFSFGGTKGKVNELLLTAVEIMDGKATIHLERSEKNG